MSNLVKKNEISKHELALIKNDLSQLSQEERLFLYNETCKSLGLNPLTQPFGFIEFRGGKLSLYAKKDCTDQLRKIHNVSIEIVSKENLNDIFTVVAKAKDKHSRIDEDMGAVPIKGLFGDQLANAMMKAITKAKRRVTLSICGLGILDESEIETIKDAKIVNIDNEIKTIAPAQNESKKDMYFLATESESIPKEEKPIVNHAIQTNDVGDWKDYKLKFTFGAFKSGTTFEQLGKNDTESLVKYIKTWQLSNGKSHKQFDEFLELANKYLESLKWKNSYKHK